MMKKRGPLIMHEIYLIEEFIVVNSGGPHKGHGIILI